MKSSWQRPLSYSIQGWPCNSGYLISEPHSAAIGAQGTLYGRGDVIWAMGRYMGEGTLHGRGDTGDLHSKGGCEGTLYGQIQGTMSQNVMKSDYGDILRIPAAPPPFLNLEHFSGHQPSPSTNTDVQEQDTGQALGGCQDWQYLAGKAPGGWHLPLSYSIQDWLWSTGLEHQPGPGKRTQSEQLLRRLRCKSTIPGSENWHSDATGQSACAPAAPAVSSVPPSHADDQQTPSVPDGIAVLESKNVTSFEKYEQGLARRSADLTLFQEHC